MNEAIDAASRLLGRKVTAAHRLSGGDISAVFRLTLERGDTLIGKHAATAATEAVMLKAMSAAGAPVPRIHAFDDEWLLMEEIDHGARVQTAWPDLARILDRLHAFREGEGRYGWAVDHAFGPVKMENGWAESWPAFWADRRLRCHLPFLGVGLARRIERLADRIDALLPARPVASLLHGDLWGGNVLVAGHRVRALIDPACYYGDREVDAAMLTLFDRPSRSFFEALALVPGWRERQPIYRLWPLLVHLRLFGCSYADSVSNALVQAGF